ncbi:MAG: Endo,4-beta-xylanase [Herbinix sp.]|jgi:endo-1,4-beta-xylanase|nr:Endo,4-beta-xylanase [Herbinix sp.]
MQGLKDKYKNFFKVGAAVNSRTIKSHTNIITEHFNSITCENEMKFSSLTMDKGIYNFNAADQIYEYAMQNNLALRGHTMIWHNQTPEWVFHGADREQLLNRIKSHIATVGARYSEQVICWDIVNEAIEDKKERVLRHTKWLEILGERYLDDVFQIAKKIMPDKQLFYNDYNETLPDKSLKIYQTIKAMQERGVPIDGIGMQCHCNIFGPTVDDLKRSIELYAELGLRIHVTEMDVSLYEFNDHSIIDKPCTELINKQAKVYEDFFGIFREYKDYIDCVTLWGVADDATWLDNFPAKNRKNWPLLFDENHNPKEAFYRIMEF